MRKYRYKKTYRAKKKKSFFRRGYFWFSVGSSFFVIAVLYLLLFSPVFQIKNIEISGNVKTESQNIKNVISEKINRKILFLNSKNIFLADIKAVSQKILEDFPQIAQANIKTKLPGTLKTEIKERIAVANWCQKEDCFFCDIEGIIFEEGKQKNRLIINDQRKIEKISLGGRVIEKKYLDSILAIQKKANVDFKMEIKEFVIPETEEKISVATSAGCFIYFYPRENITDQLFNLEIILKEKISPEDLGNLEYIDLRFGNKIYYKYKRG